MEPTAGGYSSNGPIRLTVHNDILHEIDHRLFGQFLERATFGEPGPEGSLIPGTRQLQPRVVEMMKQMKIPVIRFPGGTDADYIDWRDLVDNVPGRHPDRPLTVGHSGRTLTNNFGLDEYFGLRDALDCQTIFVVNFLEAVARRKPLREAAILAAGVVAYANAPVGTPLPEGMPDWPAIRARNGHPDPYGLQYIQIGNECMFWLEAARKGCGLDDGQELANWYIQCLAAYIELIRQVDPSVQFIIDAHWGDDALTRAILADPAIRQHVRYATVHYYKPGPIDQLKRDGQPYPSEKMTAQDWWYAWTGMLGYFSEEGQCLATARIGDTARSLGYQIACTEWNWNGWGIARMNPRPSIDFTLAAGLGAVGFLHGLMRHGNTIKLAAQSLLVGHGWDITAIRVDPAAQNPPYYYPQGQATLFCSRHHGRHLLRTSAGPIPAYEQPYQVGWATPEKRVAYLDVLATASAEVLYVHILNRHFDQPFDLAIELSDFDALAPLARHHLFTGRLYREPRDGEGREVGRFTEQSVALAGKRLALSVPPRSASIVEIQRSRVS